MSSVDIEIAGSEESEEEIVVHSMRHTFASLCNKRINFNDWAFIRNCRLFHFNESKSQFTLPNYTHIYMNERYTMDLGYHDSGKNLQMYK